MPDRKSRPSERPTRCDSDGRAIVWLRFLIVPAWIAATVWRSPTCPRPSNPKPASWAACCRTPPGARSRTKAIETFGLPLLSRTMVVARRAAAASPPRRPPPPPLHRRGRPQRRAGRDQGGAAHRRARHARRRRSATTIVAYLYLDPALSEDESQESAERFAAGLEQRHPAPDGEGDRRAAGDPGGNRDRRKPPDLGRAGDRPARRRDPRLLLPLARASRCWAWRPWRSPTSAPTASSAGSPSATGSRSRARPSR